jgi:hypothetical protein
VNVPLELKYPDPLVAALRVPFGRGSSGDRFVPSETPVSDVAVYNQLAVVVFVPLLPLVLVRETLKITPGMIGAAGGTFGFATASRACCSTLRTARAIRLKSLMLENFTPLAMFTRFP